MSKPNEILDAIGVTLGLVLPDFFRNARPGMDPETIGATIEAVIDKHLATLRAAPAAGAYRLHGQLLRGMTRGVGIWLDHLDHPPNNPPPG